ncbi:hypothetical protein O181_012570 [Austropuccinia psidii MF-1]|uniref:Uncharacterized protein n=1 Tax=Austropuccinia psidii MF-1 TaxID=1389203 RepID=A0A9Q3GN28_9BASI|nr:hypothetical protein [Austropuccinia psidii MF-1]
MAHAKKNQKRRLSYLSYQHKEAFASDRATLSLKQQEVDIFSNADRPYAPLPRRLAYPINLKSCESLRINIIKLYKVKVLEKSLNHDGI